MWSDLKRVTTGVISYVAVVRVKWPSPNPISLMSSQETQTGHTVMEMEVTLPPCSVTRSYAGPPGAEKTRKDCAPGRLRRSVALLHVVSALQTLALQPYPLLCLSSLVGSTQKRQP